MPVPTILNCPAVDISGIFSLHGEAASAGVRRDLAYLLAEYERLDILASAQSTYGAVFGGARIPDENLGLRELTQTQDPLFQWLVVDPADPAAFAQAEAMLSSPKVLGLRLPNSTRRCSIAAYADALFSMAQEQMVAVMVHPSHVQEAVQFAEKYPDVPVIVPQLCIERLDKPCFAECIAETPNVYTDTAGGPSVCNHSLEYVADVCGADRILFASGGESLAFEKARILLSPLSREDQEKILLHNALRIFPKLAQWLDSRKEVLL